MALILMSIRRGTCLFLAPPAINYLILTSTEACSFLKSSTISNSICCFFLPCCVILQEYCSICESHQTLSHFLCESLATRDYVCELATLVLKPPYHCHNIHLLRYHKSQKLTRVNTNIVCHKVKQQGCILYYRKLQLVQDQKLHQQNSMA